MTSATFAVPERPRAGESRRAALLVFLTLAMALTAGWLLKDSVEARSKAFVSPDGTLQLSYPAGWVVAAPEGDTWLSVADAGAGFAFAPRFSVTHRPVYPHITLPTATANISLRRADSLREYRELTSESTTVAGQRAARVTYGYVADPPEGAGPATLPIVVQATDWIVLKDSRVFIFTAAAEFTAAEEYASAFDRVLATVEIK